MRTRIEDYDGSGGRGLPCASQRVRPAIHLLFHGFLAFSSCHSHLHLGISIHQGSLCTCHYRIPNEIPADKADADAVAHANARCTDVLH